VIEPNIKNGSQIELDEKVPYIFNIYEWDLEKLKKMFPALKVK
jgi:hypothetical protein